MLPKQPNQSLIDGMRCLQAVLTENRPVGASDLVRSLGIELTRAHRLLRTLAHMGFLEQGAGRKYVTGPAFTILAAQAIQASPLLKQALPVLEELRKTTGYTVALGVLWQRSVSYLYHAGPKLPVEKAIGGNETWPARKSGLGMALLAKLEDEEIRKTYGEEGDALVKELRAIRRIGYAYVATMPGKHTLALVVPGQPGVALGLTGGMTASEAKKAVPQLAEAAQRISLGN